MTYKLDASWLLLGLKQMEGRTAWRKQQRAELMLDFHAEMLHGQAILPIVRRRFVERCTPQFPSRIAFFRRNLRNELAQLQLE